jgi:hypothetical protein
MVIALDPGDIAKPYARAMELLCGIYDGSCGEPARGYHLCQVTAASLQQDKLVSLYCEDYSSDAADYNGVTDKLKTIIDKVTDYIGTKGIWAIDRQGDNKELITHLRKNYVLLPDLNKTVGYNYVTALNTGLYCMQKVCSCISRLNTKQ